ncbi:MAG: hypothetical protein JXR70_04410 [Spirochaetales bacterium]|nr:hypothetical protein [Spirochaetales bacterium]
MFITLYKVENDVKKMFSIHDHQQSLFDLHCFATYSVINGKMTKEKQYSFESKSERDGEIKKLFHQKIQDGYKMLYSFPGELSNLIEKAI